MTITIMNMFNTTREGAELADLPEANGGVPCEEAGLLAVVTSSHVSRDNHLH